MHSDGVVGAPQWKSRFYVKMGLTCPGGGWVITKISEDIQALMTLLELTLSLDRKIYH
jgi:hypothetical protein